MQKDLRVEDYPERLVRSARYLLRKMHFQLAVALDHRARFDRREGFAHFEPREYRPAAGANTHSVKTTLGRVGERSPHIVDELLLLAQLDLGKPPRGLLVN